jgi:hypothetical protein
MDLKIISENDKYFYLAYRFYDYPKVYNYKLPKIINKTNINLNTYILNKVIEQRNIKKNEIDFNVCLYE